MFGRTIFGVLAAVALVALVAVIGTSVYNAGLSQGVAEAARVAAASGDPAPVVVAPYGGDRMTATASARLSERVRLSSSEPTASV